MKAWRARLEATASKQKALQHCTGMRRRCLGGTFYLPRLAEETSPIQALLPAAYVHGGQLFLKSLQPVLRLRFRTFCFGLTQIRAYVGLP